jgi:hypothetical protein
MTNCFKNYQKDLTTTGGVPNFLWVMITIVLAISSFISISNHMEQKRIERQAMDFVGQMGKETTKLTNQMREETDKALRNIRENQQNR